MAEVRNARVLGPVLVGFCLMFGVAGLLIHRLWEPRVKPDLGFSARARAASPVSVDAGVKTPKVVVDPLNDPSQPDNEYEYLHELERLSVENKSKALELAFAGEHWYGARGPAAEARRAMQVTLLADIGRMKDALERAKQFARDFPDSSYLPTVRGAVRQGDQDGAGAALEQAAVPASQGR